jgi:hypothetical protein
MAAEIAGLICAASIAETNGATSQAATYQATALAWASEVDSTTYTTSGPYGGGYFLRITPDGSPNSGSSIGIANGGGSHDDRTVVDPGFLEQRRGEQQLRLHRQPRVRLRHRRRHLHRQRHRRRLGGRRQLLDAQEAPCPCSAGDRARDGRPGPGLSSPGP